MRPELGVCYYPEHWPEEQWATDANDMKAMGLSWVRIGEFAWKQIEPKPGQYDWGWLDRAIETLEQAGLKIVLGTPSATPPRWLIDQMPDCLAVDTNGQKRKFGSRRHYCFSHDGYREAAVKIAKDMAERYGNHPYIQAWQIDNEYGCHDTIVSYSDAAAHGFRNWLEAKYKTIDTLNDAWGNLFWSMSYDRFEQIELPNQTVTEPNPAHVMDFRRFSSDQVVRFNKAQADVLREYSDKPFIHNYMGRITDFDHFKVGEDLDIASWDSYPLGFLEDRSDQGDDFKHNYRRQGDPDFQAFHHDLYRAVGKKGWWVMEQQPGPVNWAPYNPVPLPGMVRLWSWEAIAHGADVVSYFRWRQAPFGQEQMHAGLQRPNGDWAEGAEEAKQVSKELLSLDDIRQTPADVAIVFDYESAWAWEIQPQGKDFDYFRLVYDTYRGLRRLGLSIDIIPPNTDDFGDRKLICIPGLFAWSDNLKKAIARFEGRVLVGPRTGSKTENFKIPMNLPPDLRGLDVEVTSVETLRPSAPVPLKENGNFQIWKENVTTDVTVVQITRGGEPALLQQSNVFYLAGWPDDAAMDNILQILAKATSLDTHKMIGGERRREFGDFTLISNYDTGTISLVSGETILIFE